MSPLISPIPPFLFLLFFPFLFTPYPVYQPPYRPSRYGTLTFYSTRPFFTMKTFSVEYPSHSTSPFYVLHHFICHHPLSSSGAPPSLFLHLPLFCSILVLVPIFLTFQCCGAECSSTASLYAPVLLLYIYLSV